MAVVAIHEARTHFLKLIEQVEHCREVIIGRAGKPVARLVPYAEAKPLRKPGTMKGKIKIKPGFYEADQEIEAGFYGEAD